MIEFLSGFESLAGSRWAAPTLTLVRVALILTAAWIAIRLFRRVLRAFRLRIEARLDDPEAIRRTETISRVFRYTATVVISLIALMLVLSEFGVSLAPILGAAGVVGLAVGFGAQSLVRDYFAGFFILFEDQIRKGDVVRIAGIGGLVEDVTLRHVRLRDFEGNVHYVPNNLITTVTNMSRGFAQALIEIGIAYREDTDQAFEVMRAVGREMRADDAFGPRILDDLEVIGVERWDNSAVTLRCRFKCKPLEQWAVRREYLRRLKKAFDAAGIEIPYPHMTVYAGVGKDGTAPPLPLRILRAPAK